MSVKKYVSMHTISFVTLLLILTYLPATIVVDFFVENTSCQSVNTNQCQAIWVTSLLLGWSVLMLVIVNAVVAPLAFLGLLERVRDPVVDKSATYRTLLFIGMLLAWVAIASFGFLASLVSQALAI